MGLAILWAATLLEEMVRAAWMCTVYTANSVLTRSLALSINCLGSGLRRYIIPKASSAGKATGVSNAFLSAPLWVLPPLE